jgi:hypothetical protein
MRPGWNGGGPHREEVTEMTETTSSTIRDRALRRLKKRRDFSAHLITYVLVNGVVVLLWLLSAQDGFFWPIFLMAFWGIGVALNGWDVWRGDDFTDAEIQREIERMNRGH